jgi:hypothetical protein
MANRKGNPETITDEEMLKVYTVFQSIKSIIERKGKLAKVKPLASKM